MGILDDLLDDDQKPTYSTTVGGSRLDMILADLDALPKTDDFPQENLDRLIAMLEGPVTEYGHKWLLVKIHQVCAALGVDTRELTYQNVIQWRAKRWAEL